MKKTLEPWTLTDSLDKQPERQNKDMRLGSWNVSSLYKTGSLMTVLKELSEYKLDLVGVQVSWLGRWQRTCRRIHILLQESRMGLLSFHLLSKNLKIRIHKTTNLPVLLYGCKTWSLTLRKCLPGNTSPIGPSFNCLDYSRTVFPS
jgi:hypothetical protein